jgi:hypothetical protein
MNLSRGRTCAPSWHHRGVKTTARRQANSDTLAKKKAVAGTSAHAPANVAAMKNAVVKSTVANTAAKKKPAPNNTLTKPASPHKAAQPSAKPAKPTKPAARPAPRAKPGPGPRADLGAPIDSFFAKRTGPLRQVLDELRAMIEGALPDAASSIKWGMPFYTLEGKPVCALAAFKAHVNLILAGRDGTFDDPDGLLEGDGKTGRHLKLRAPDDIPRSTVRGWLVAAAAGARRAN